MTEQIILTTEFWDCTCDTDFINPAKFDYCPICGILREEMPDSRINEILKYTIDSLINICDGHLELSMVQHYLRQVKTNLRKG